MITAAWVSTGWPVASLNTIQASWFLSQKGEALAVATSDSKAAKVYNDHNVYVLGAGFSAEAGLPLVKNFMNRMRDAAAWLEKQAGREREREAIERVLTFRLSAAGAAFRVPLKVENVEELFSLASASGDEELAKAMPTAIAATLDYARATARTLLEHERFDVGVRNVPGWTSPNNWEQPSHHVRQRVMNGDLTGEWYGCPPYDFYVGVMCSYFNRGNATRRDTIISFNYDTVVEDVLRSLGIGTDYGFPDESIEYDTAASEFKASTSGRRVEVLKPHGSANWAALWPEQQERFVRRYLEVKIAEANEKGALGGDVLKEIVGRSFEHIPIRRLQIYRDYPALRNDNQWAASVFLSPPTWQKRFGSYLSRVWDRAVEALQTATRIIILGYSIPETDQHFRYLLGAGLRDNISLRKVFFVNSALMEEGPRNELEQRLLKVFRREHLDEGVIELVPTDIRGFFAGPRHMSEESYRVHIGRSLNPSGYSPETVSWSFISPIMQGLTFD
jgi:hypothetical protein